MDPWSELRRLTSARIALGRSGGSVPTRARLDFQLAHARARDAVLSPFDAQSFAAKLGAFAHPVLVVESAAANRAEYLRRPDLGRRLSAKSRASLAAQSAPTDIAIILSDGLSTNAVESQSEPLLAALLPTISKSRWTLAPIIVARHGRVALQDEIGELLHATVSLMLIGERPGLGSANSLGAYLTYAPAAGRTDADRNCVSNIRKGGLPIPEAAMKLHYLLGQILCLRLSGVHLKDNSAALPAPPPSAPLA